MINIFKGAELKKKIEDSANKLTRILVETDRFSIKVNE